MIEIKKLQYVINREAAKISALWNEKIGKYHLDHLADEEMSPDNRRQITEQAKSTYFSFGKAFEK